MERFAERFARAGFRRSALTPVYGLAECTVGLAIPPLERGVVVDRIQRDALLLTQRALPAAAEDTAALRYVACGRPLPGHEMRIVDDTGQEVAERIVGRLQFRGPSATQGYYRNPEETRKLLEGGWLNTGDIGYMAGGDLYLTSRAKDVIIRGGRNVYPYELEEAVGNLPGVRKGCVAAVGVADEASGTERLLVLVEKRDPASGNDDELRSRVQSLANELLGSPADEVVLLPPNSVLKTSSGKIRRAATRDAYLQGMLGRRGASVRLQFARMALQSGYGSVRRGGRKVGAWLRAARGWTAFVLLAPLAWATAVLSREPAP
jgi:acyl-CoA synthetase (AMP-forming)/AMP-acid ligase II